MPSPMILISFPATAAQRQAILDAAPDFRCVFKQKDAITPADLAEAEIEFGNLPADMLRDAKNLRWLQLNSAGADAYTKPGALDSAVSLTSAVGAYGLSVSEHLLAMLLAMNRNFPRYFRNQSAAAWQPEGAVRSIEGSAILTLGLGDIGGDFARKVKALGAYTLGVRRNAAEKPDYLDELHPMADLDALLPRADVAVICLPLTEETRGLFDARRLSLMRHDALLMNIGRGPIVDTDALVTALRANELGGACLDVTDPEPLPPDHPLWKFPNVMITPHVAGQFFLPETTNRIVRIFLENLENYRQNKPLRNLTAH